MTPLSSRDLNRALALLVGLTVLSVTTSQWEGAGTAATALVLAASLFKARQVLDHFLGLKQAGPPWRTAITAGLAVLLSTILAIGLL